MRENHLLRSINDRSVCRCMFELRICSLWTNFSRYVDSILKSTPREVDQVTIEPNGVWRRTSDDDNVPPKRGESDSDDGDLVEIKDMPRMAAVKSEYNYGNGSPLMRTPPMSSREPSISSAKPTSTTHKRAAPEVIDLSSDDDDDEPLRAPKRQATNSYSSQSNGVSLSPYSPGHAPPTFPASTTYPLPRPMQPGPLATSNPMAPGYRNPPR